MNEWQPIETVPKDDRTMLVVRAFNVKNRFTGGVEYTSDPWCVWVDVKGSEIVFCRWPHRFPPTHWMPLPPPPEKP